MSARKPTLRSAGARGLARVRSLVAVELEKGPHGTWGRGADLEQQEDRRVQADVRAALAFIDQLLAWRAAK